MLVQLGPRSFFFPDNFDLYFKCSVPCLCGIFLPPKMITIVTQQQYSQCPLKVYENYECGFISGLYPVLLIYMSVFMPVPYSFDYYSFVVQSEVRKNIIPLVLFFFLRIVLDIWGLLCCHMNLKLFSLLLGKIPLIF